MWQPHWALPEHLVKFLLTHPVWDVTLWSLFYLQDLPNFYSHIPCGMWLRTLIMFVYCCKFLLTHPVWDVTQVNIDCFTGWCISTHTSRVGCDSIVFSISRFPPKFLLTHPVWDVTLLLVLLNRQTWISTHTSRVGCDSAVFFPAKICFTFLLTHPVWDVTNTKTINQFLN